MTVADQVVCIKKPGSQWSNCQCEPCRKHRLRMQKLRRCGASAAGHVPAEAAWARLDDLLAAGWTVTAIAEAAGIRFQAVWLALHRRERGVQKSLSHRNATAILSIPDDETTTPGWASEVGVRRRLQALAAVGWSSNAILIAAPSLGVQGDLSPDTLSKIRRGHILGRVHRETARFVRAVYEPLSNRTPPAGHSATVTRRRAVASGWVPPAGWDNGQLDDPAAQPYASIPVDLDEVNIQRCVDGRIPASDLTITERREAVRILHGRGLSDGEIAATVGLVSETVMRIRRRIGLPANNVEGQHSSVRATTVGGTNRSALYGTAG